MVWPQPKQEKETEKEGSEEEKEEQDLEATDTVDDSFEEADPYVRETKTVINADEGNSTAGATVQNQVVPSTASNELVTSLQLDLGESPALDVNALDKTARLRLEPA